MRPHPRIRKTIKWGGALVVLLSLACWVGSAWVWVDYVGDRALVMLDFGRVSLTVYGDDQDPDGPGWYVRVAGPQHRGRFAWGFERINPWRDAVRYYCPLWVPVMLCACPTAFAWWRDRRWRAAGHCPGCRYNLSGLPAGAVCPECGAPPVVASSA